MRKTIIAAGIALASLAGMASAATVTITDFGVKNAVNIQKINTAFSAATAGGLIETFESGFTSLQTDAAGAPIRTAVGTFATHGAVIGSGTTCRKLQSCDRIVIQNDAVSGQPNNQGNIVPVGGTWSLNSSDTGGMFWNAARADGLSFTKLVFAIRDAADQGTTWSVMTEGMTAAVSDTLNGNLKLVVIDFGRSMLSADVTLTAAANDAFTIDGAALSAVPVPAAGLLLMGGLGALGALRKRKKAAAAA